MSKIRFWRKFVPSDRSQRASARTARKAISYQWNNTARPITARGNRVYLHFLKEPGGSFCWADVKNRVKSARLLADGRPIPFQQEGNRLFLKNLPMPLPDTPATTVELELDGKPEAITTQTSFWIPG